MKPTADIRLPDERPLFYVILIHFYSKPRPRWKLDVSISNLKRRLEIAFAQMDIFLDQEIRNGRVDLQGRSQVNGAVRVVRRDGSIIALGHCGDVGAFQDAA